MTSAATIERLTAAGRGAVAVIRVQLVNPGDEIQLTRHFRSASNRNLQDVTEKQISYGRWDDEDVVLVRSAPTEWEIHCHGGDAAVQKIRNDLQSLFRADDVTDSAPQTLQEQLLQQLLKCRTRKTAGFLLNQHQGTYREFLNTVVHETSDDRARTLITSFMQHERFATHLVTPWPIVVCGQPNAGKSSLLNTILGYDRAIVHDQPGTTRDRIAAEVIIQSWPFEFVDTAGLRNNASDDVETAGIEAAQEVMQKAALAIIVVDSTAGWTDNDDAIVRMLPAHSNVVVAWNKIDAETSEPIPETLSHRVFQISAVLNTGVRELLDDVATTLMPDVPAKSAPLPVLPSINLLLTDYLNKVIDLTQLQQSLHDQL